MAVISSGSTDTLNSFNLDGLDYDKGGYEIYYSNILYDGSGQLREDQIRIGIRNSKETKEIIQEPVKISEYSNSLGESYSDYTSLLTDMYNLGLI